MAEALFVAWELEFWYIDFDVKWRPFCFRATSIVIIRTCADVRTEQHSAATAGVRRRGRY